MEWIKRFCWWNCHFSISLTLAVLQRHKKPTGYWRYYHIQDVGHLAVMGPGVHTMSDELILQFSCNIFPAFKWILMMTSGQNISHYTTAQLSVHVWNHDLIWWQNKIDTQKHFHKTTITSSWTQSKTKIPITIVKAQMPSNTNQKSHTRDNKVALKARSYRTHFSATLCRVVKAPDLSTKCYFFSLYTVILYKLWIVLWYKTRCEWLHTDKLCGTQTFN